MYFAQDAAEFKFGEAADVPMNKTNNLNLDNFISDANYKK